MKWILLCMALLLSAVAAANSQAILLNIKGGIGPAVHDFVSRGIQQAEKQKANVVILQIDTPGGLSKSMRGIIKDILNSSVPVISYVAPSGARAASAGTYILYASHIAAMAPGTNLGAATPVSMGMPGGSGKDKAKKPSASKAKAINDARAYIRALAQMRGRNVKWAELAVTKAASLSADEALKKHVIDVVARNIPALLKAVNGRTVVVQGQKRQLQTSNLNIHVIHPDWRTRFLTIITDPSIAYILLMIGFYGLFFEFVNPGFVLPGVLGGICLLLSLYAMQLLPINYAGLALILLGMSFIVAEAFLPSVGALGIGGVISFAIGSIMLLKTNTAGYAISLTLIIGVCVMTTLFFLGVLQLAFKARRRPVVSGQEAMLGKTAIIVMSGSVAWARVNGELWQVKNCGGLQKGQRVIVAGVDGLKLIIKEE